MTRSESAFSLVEVVLALGVIAFALVAILGVFPLGLEASRASITETRVGQLATTVFSTLRTPPFNAVTCYGQTLDLGTLDTSSTAQVFYAAYADPDLPIITSSEQPNSIYSLELRFNSSGVSAAKNSGNSFAGFPKGQANEVSLAIYPLHQPAAAQRFISTITKY